MTIRENEIEPFEARPNLYVVSLALSGRPVDTAYIWRGPIKIALINQLMAAARQGGRFKRCLLAILHGLGRVARHAGNTGTQQQQYPV